MCSEVTRTGAYTVGDEAVRRLSLELYQRLLSALSTLLDTAAVSSDGCLQLLFDVYFLTDVLVGPLQNPGARMAFQLAEAKIKAHIDAFDLEVMMPHVQESRGRAYQRLAMLLGFFTQLHPVHADVRVKLLSSDHHSNMLALAPVAPRFSLLPVASPQPPTNASSMRRTAGATSNHPALSVFERLGNLTAEQGAISFVE